jgi:NAD(P)-dependent dehydrogenase (short-subunit alcohol dehydrogenase family)
MVEGKSKNEVAGAVALVTGGGRGIGRAIACALAQAGATVVVSSRTEFELGETVTLIQTAGGRAFAQPADVTDRRAVDRLVRVTEQRLGMVDLLVNNAGTNVAIGPMWEIDPSLWWRDVEVNLLGTFLCIRAVLPRMIERRRGRIINIVSVSALRPTPDATAYAGAKAAVIRMTDSLAQATRPYGVNVFAVHPGTVRTAMTKYIAESVEGRRAYPGFDERPPEAWTPPSKVAAMCVLLASGGADGLSGRYLSVTDDITSLACRAKDIVDEDRYVLRLRT